MDFQNSSVTQLSKNTAQSNAVFIESIQTLINSYSMTKSLFGPNSKYILLGGRSMSLTSQPSLIFSSIPPTHPTSKILGDYIEKMDLYGDCATFMVSLVSLLAKNVFALVQEGMSKKKIEVVLKKIRKDFVNFDFDIKEEKLGDRESMERVFKGLIKNEDLLKVFIDGMEIVKQRSSIAEFIEDLDDRMRVMKIPTGVIGESYAIGGMIFKGEPLSERKEGKSVKTSIYNCPIEISRTVTKGTILLENAEELMSFSKEEESGIRAMVESLTKYNELVFCNGKVENMFIDYFNERNAIVFNIYSKHDIRRLRNLIGGCISPVLREVMENGTAEEVSVFEEGNKKYTKIIGAEGGVATLVLRNSITFILDEYERVLNKTIKFTMKNYKDGSIQVVKGAGDFERDLSRKMEDIMKTCEDSSRQVYKAFCDALNDLAIKESDENVFDGFEAKMKAIQYAIEILCIVLDTDNYFFVRVNDMNIKPRTNKNWDED